MKNLFSIFSESSNSFEDQEKGERVILLLRRHPFVILIKLFVFAVFALLPVLVGLYFSAFLYGQGLLQIYVFLASLYYLLLWSAVFYSLTMYALDVWIVTDRRVIDSKQHGFFNRTTAELHISRIQDISVQTNGVLQTVLKFGNLQIQTAGAEEKFDFLQIPHPERVRMEIMHITHPSEAIQI